MFVKELWRYPVKSMAGESLNEAEFTTGGIAGDRLVCAVNPAGRVVTARTRPKLLGHKAVLGPAGQPLVDGRPWQSPEVAAGVEAAAGKGVRLMLSDQGVFDILPLLVVTDGSIAAFGHDRRRLRPNLVIGGVEGLAERDWENRKLRIGEAIVDFADLRGRCVMTTFDPDTLVQNPDVLKHVVRTLEGKVGLNAAVARGGRVRVGDAVELI